MKHPYIPIGVDLQGRQPEAAHVCTDLGADDDADGLNAARGLLHALMWSLALWFVGAVVAVAVMWP